jgi:GINS complex subunit 1
MNYCDLSVSLVRSYSRFLSSSSLPGDVTSLSSFPSYDSRILHEVTRECAELYSNLFELNERIRNAREQSESASDSASFLLFYTSLQRNKRCILAYLNARIESLKSALWEIGGSSAALMEGLEQAKAPNEAASNEKSAQILSKEEIHFLHEYEKALLDYQKSSGIELNSHLQPPSDLLVEVRVLRSVGIVETSTGSVNLEVGSTHLLKRQDAELFIRQGILKQTDQEK